MFLQLCAKKYKNSAQLIHVQSDSSKSGPLRFMTDSAVYSGDFNPTLNLFYASYLTYKEAFDFYRQRVDKFYAKYGGKWNNKTARLLEFGGGPVIANLISAVPYVNQITLQLTWRTRPR